MLFFYQASDGSSSREDLSSQLFRRNEQIRKLEVKLSGMCPDMYKMLLLQQIFSFELKHFNLLKVHGFRVWGFVLIYSNPVH